MSKHWRQPESAYLSLPKLDRNSKLLGRRVKNPRCVEDTHEAACILWSQSGLLIVSMCGEKPHVTLGSSLSARSASAGASDARRESATCPPCCARTKNQKIYLLTSAESCWNVAKCYRNVAETLLKCRWHFLGLVLDFFWIFLFSLSFSFL